jgi:hypothetical protein
MTRLLCVLATCATALVVACTSAEKEPDFPGSFRYSGYAGRKIVTDKDSLIRIGELDPEVRDTLERTGFHSLKTFDFRPGDVVVISTESSRTVTAKYAVSDDSVTVTLPGEEGVLPLSLQQGRLTIMQCIYDRGFWIENGPCKVPPPDVWPFTSYFASRDTLPASEVTFIFGK